MSFEIIPTATVRRFFRACRKDEVFKADMKEIEGDEYVKPHRFSNVKMVLVYSATYAGWLLGRGYFEKYKQLDKGTYEFNN